MTGRRRWARSPIAAPACCWCDAAGCRAYANQDGTVLIPGARTVVNDVLDTATACVASDGPFCDDATLDTSQVERPVPERRELTCPSWRISRTRKPERSRPSSPRATRPTSKGHDRVTRVTDWTTCALA